MACTIAQIAQHIGGRVKGDENHIIDNFATLQKAQSNQISFLSNTKYKQYLATTKAGVVIVADDLADIVTGNAIIVTDPYVAYAKAATFIGPDSSTEGYVHPSAVIHSSVSIDSSVSVGANVVIAESVAIGQRVQIGAGTVIESGSHIGDDSRLLSNVTIAKECRVGKRCIIHSGAVIGADGFGLANDNGHWIKIPQTGAVVLADDVEVGANTTIDRGALDDTMIGKGTKIDNQVQIAHNVVIGEHVVIAGCTGIAGSTRIGDHCIFGGAISIAGHLSIADHVVLTGMTMVTKSITKSGMYSSGIPADTNEKWRKQIANFRRIDVMAEKIKQLQSKK